MRLADRNTRKDTQNQERELPAMLQINPKILRHWIRQ